MTAPTFHDLSLRDAEAELVGACIDHEMALRIALILLPVDDFRSEAGYELRRVFYVLAGWLSKGIYDEETNRERLALYFPDLWLESIWCPFGAVDEYIEALCRAVVRSNQLFDSAVAARGEWLFNNPLMSSAPVPPPAARPPGRPPQEGGSSGGIKI